MIIFKNPVPVPNPKRMQLMFVLFYNMDTYQSEFLTDDIKRYNSNFNTLLRRGCRAAEGPALEKRYPVKNGIVGSNPTLSANDFRHLFLFETFEKCSFLFKAKESENFNHRNTLSILRIKI